MENEEVILPYVQDYVSRYAWTPWGKVRVAKAQLGGNAALLGAIPFASRPEFNPTSKDMKNVR